MKLVMSLPILIGLSAWAAACLWVDGPESRLLAGFLATGFVAASLFIVGLARPIWRMWLAFAVLFLAVQIWWLGIDASNDRDWLPGVAQLPSATIEGDLVTLQNVRNFHYRSDSDFDEIWETRSYDLSKLEGVDLFLSYWGSPMIAHTIASWQFSDGKHLAISIETRKEVGESYSALLGFFRQYELYYTVADERDLIGVRTNFRGEEVYLYRLKTKVPVARAIFLDYLKSINELVEEPTWYNALSTNCTTTIRRHVQHVAPRNPFDWRILVNGYIDELGYERGQLDNTLPFDEMRRQSEITQKAQAAGNRQDFSALIRADLPGPHEPAS